MGRCFSLEFVGRVGVRWRNMKVQLAPCPELRFVPGQTYRLLHREVSGQNQILEFWLSKLDSVVSWANVLLHPGAAGVQGPEMHVVEPNLLVFRTTLDRQCRRSQERFQFEFHLLRFAFVDL